MSRPLEQARVPLALVAEIAQLDPMAAQLYLALWVLPGAEWAGSKRAFSSMVSAITGKAKERGRLDALLRKLQDIGAIRFEDGASSLRVWVVRDSDQSVVKDSDRVVKDSDHFSASLVRDSDHSPPPPPAPPLPDLNLDRSLDLNRIARPLRARALYSKGQGAIPVRSGRPVTEPVYGAADGMREAIHALDARLRPSEAQFRDVLDYVRADGVRVGAAGIQKQMDAWKARDTAFCRTTERTWGYFRKLCIDDAAPSAAPPPPRSSSPASRSVAEVLNLPAPEDCCTADEWMAAHPEGAAAWLGAEVERKRRNEPNG